MGSREIGVGLALVTLLNMTWAFAQPRMEAATAAANPLLAIDQHRATVIDRIVRDWGEPLEQSSARLNAGQLRTMLAGLRADHLLAASLAGTLDGLRNVLAIAVTVTNTAREGSMHAKALGDSTIDLVYTPVTPCRIVDTRGGGGGVLAGGNQRNWLTYSPTGFAGQGGSATNCGIAVRPAAVMMNVTLANTVGGPEFFTVWPSGQARPNASTLNWAGTGQQPANAEIVPLCAGGGCTFDFSAFASGQTHAIIDVLGYFNRPGNYGGTHTITGLYATDSGGFNNTVSAPYSTVGGGIQNTASAGFATVAGGQNNKAQGNNATVAGGVQNTASGTESTVGGGAGNIASGLDSTVVGGLSNTASGDRSFAAGRFARADANNCAVFSLWADVAGPGMPCFGVQGVFAVGAPTGMSFDYFAQRPDGGGFRWVAIGRINGQTIATWTGAFLTDAGVWVNASSSKASKTDFAPVDSRQVLAQVARLPITTWRYKVGEEAGVRHMGPMAEDFDAAFGIGYGPQTIADLDARGVALAAIQGLNAKLEEQHREIAELKRLLVDLQSMMR